MELRMPSDASSFATWFGADVTDLVHGSANGDAALSDITPERLDQALAALEQGHVEYLGLHEGEAFLQVAGEGAGPYQIELHPGPPGFPVSVPAGVTVEAVRYALHGFLTSDPTWAQPFPWEPMGAPAQPVLEDRKLRRIFRRS
jgi:hypothetical protein